MNIDWPELSKLLVAFIGGLITAYFTHFLSNYREKRKLAREEKRELRQIKVVGDIEIIGGPDPLPSDLQIVITAINIGFRPITIANAGLILEDDKGRTISQFGVSSNHVPWPSLPKTIGDGEAVKLYLDLALALRFTEEIKKLSHAELPDSSISSVFVKDVEGIEYTVKLPPDKKSIINAVISGEFPAHLND